LLCISLVKEEIASLEWHETIDIGQEQAYLVVLVYFYPHLNMQKTLLIMDPNNTKNCSLTDFSHI